MEDFETRYRGPNMWRLSLSECIAFLHRTFERNTPHMLCLEEKPPLLSGRFAPEEREEVSFNTLEIGTILKIPYQSALGNDLATFKKVGRYEWYLWMEENNSTGARLISSTQIVKGEIVKKKENGLPQDFVVSIGELTTSQNKDVYWLLPTVYNNKAALLPCKVNHIWYVMTK